MEYRENKIIQIFKCFSVAADGFTLGNNSAVNYNNDYFASFNWLGGDGASNNTDGTVTSSVSANPTAGFSVVTFTGTGSALTVGHGLSQAPEFIIAKSSASNTNWPMYGPASTGPSNIMYFNLSNTWEQTQEVLQQLVLLQ